mmetsp:Transcript_99524/g.277001  ORF Transcript_99524/g.277001 Transcript_99524/m.277001 type:complete len:523 (-) Transcript_99524:854-2422(-)
MWPQCASNSPAAKSRRCSSRGGAPRTQARNAASSSPSPSSPRASRSSNASNKRLDATISRITTGQRESFCGSRSLLTVLVARVTRKSTPRGKSTSSTELPLNERCLGKQGAQSSGRMQSSTLLRVCVRRRVASMREDMEQKKPPPPKATQTPPPNNDSSRSSSESWRQALSLSRSRRKATVGSDMGRYVVLVWRTPRSSKCNRAVCTSCAHGASASAMAPTGRKAPGRSRGCNGVAPVVPSVAFPLPAAPEQPCGPYATRSKLASASMTWNSQASRVYSQRTMRSIWKMSPWQRAKAVDIASAVKCVCQKSSKVLAEVEGAPTAAMRSLCQELRSSAVLRKRWAAAPRLGLPISHGPQSSVSQEVVSRFSSACAMLRQASSISSRSSASSSGARLKMSRTRGPPSTPRRNKEDATKPSLDRASVLRSTSATALPSPRPASPSPRSCGACRWWPICRRPASSCMSLKSSNARQTSVAPASAASISGVSPSELVSVATLTWREAACMRSRIISTAKKFDPSAAR